MAELSELYSRKNNHLLAPIHRLKFIASVVDRVEVDVFEVLIVTAKIFNHQHRIRVWLRSMDLYNFAKHPRARALSCQFSSPISDNTVIVCVNFFVCGTKSVVSLQLSGGRFKQLILDWLNCDRLDDQKIHLFHETYLFGVSTRSGSASASVYDVSKVTSISVIRKFGLSGEASTELVA
ncbi:MAG: hypothetical protein NXY57DRAFT_969152 [Lentinula lateritia]|nr:MAG: hypothetical protein NXY57DRAFT_969152 [Lentinula lateritia]